jgi:ATP-binding cassette, subfamily F, member 3
VRARRPAPPRTATPKGPSKNRLRDQADLEREIERAEATLRSLEDELADPAAWADPGRSASSSDRHESAKRVVEELYARWDALAS